MGTLHVTQTLVETVDKELVVKPPKSEAGRRRLALPDSLTEALRRHRVAQAELMLEFGPDYRRYLDLICAEINGDYVRPSKLTSAYRTLAENHGLKGVALHDLRHSHASLLLESSVDLKVVSERLGHSTITLTADTYAHVTDRLDRDAANRLDRYLTNTPDEESAG